jgi:eukaryotic-like serine/threonine-protein kinase
VSSEHWQRMEKLYHAALEREPGEREAFLEEACKGDEELRRKLTLLLAEEASNVKILDSPAWEAISRPTEAAAKTMLVEGTHLGAYVIEGRLGAGGMGEVYRAVDTRLGRKVAIKIVSEKFTALFGREARAISALNHPHICTLYDVGPDFLVMELIEGHTLSERIREGPLPLDEVLRYGAQIADALAEAHAHGIVHRDLKPGNIMVRGHNAKVLDFGLAKFTQGPDGELTQAKVTMGTPAYMAPEQVQGKASTGATDLFALGLVLYEMTAGKLPFPGASFGAMLATETETALKPPCNLRHKAAARLNTLILALLEKDSARRPQDAAAVRQKLLDAAQPRRSNLAITSAFAAVVMLTAALSWFFGLRTATPRWPKTSNVSFITTYSGDETTPAVSRDGAQVAFSWKDQGGRRSIYVSRSDGQDAPRQLTNDTAEETMDVSPAWSPDQTKIAFVRMQGALNGQIIVVPAHGGPDLKLRDIRIAGSKAGLAWTPDGTQIAFASQSLESGRSTLSLMRLADGRVRTLVSPPDGVIGDASPAFSPDKRFLAFVRWSSPTTSTLLVQKLGSDGEAVGEPVIAVAGKAPASPVWADNKRLLFLEGERILEWEAGTAAEQIYVSSAQLLGLAMAGVDARGNPRVIAAQLNSRGSRIRKIPLRAAGQAAGQPVLLPRFGMDSTGPDYSSDGKHVVFVSERSGNPELWMTDADGNNLRQLTRLGVQSLLTPRWSPDSRHVAFSARVGTDEPQIHVIDATQDQPVPRQATRQVPGCNIPSWSHDGKTLYCSRRIGGGAHLILFRVPAESPETGESQMERWFEGKSASETSDGRLLYIRDDQWGLFARSLAGDPIANLPQRLVEDIIGPTAYYAPVAEGIYYTAQNSFKEYVGLRFFDYASRKAVDVASRTTTGRVNSLTVSPDGRSLVYTEVLKGEIDLTLIQFQ